MTVASSVVVLDYGFGNIRSAQRALERLGAEVTITADRAAAVEADGLVVPGVGAFAACMDGIDKVDAASLIRERVAAGRPVLGICVGMQVLFASGEEHGVRRDGIGLLPGGIRRLEAPILPHMGWNTVAAAAGSVLFAGLDEQPRFYFVHSYARPVDGPWPDGAMISVTEYAEPFAAAVEHGVLSACQFHPEKSGDAGARLLANWLATL